jgi:hypothetical protein
MKSSLGRIIRGGLLFRSRNEAHMPFACHQVNGSFIRMLGPDHSFSEASKEHEIVVMLLQWVNE